jgi:hypothetical protein
MDKVVFGSLVLGLALLLGPAGLEASEARCRVEGDRVLVETPEGEVAVKVSGQPLDCLVQAGRVLVALGGDGVGIFELKDGVWTQGATWKPGDGEVVRLFLQGPQVVAVLGQVRLVPLTETAGGLEPQGLASLLGVGALVGSGEEAAVGQASTVAPLVPPTPPAPEKELLVKVLEVRPESAVLDAGLAQGLKLGTRLEIRSQKPITAFNLEKGREETMPSNKVTGVVEVTQVTQDRALVQLGRGDRAQRGDLLATTARRADSSQLFPPYDRELHRVQFKLAPFVAIESLNVGTFAQATLDYTFAFPMRIESGFRNLGLVFGEDFAAPFQFDVIPSYDTDFFEVGLGAGYSFSGNPSKRGFTFLQKVRLGTVDGLHFTMWNSFIYQNKGDNWWGWDSGAGGSAGDTCSGWEPETGSEFAWNGFDGELAVPVNERVAVQFHGSYSQAGWAYGDVGIKTLVVGNGGAGSMFIPVSIGGGAVVDYKASGTYLACNPGTNKLEEVKDYQSTAFGGPIVSIGIDYRW